MSDQSQELAKERTGYSEDRTLMANERTLASWLRTGFAAIAIGIAYQRLFSEIEPDWLIKAIATIFVIAGVALKLAALSRYEKVKKRLHEHVANPPSDRFLTTIVYILALAALSAMLALWFT